MLLLAATVVLVIGLTHAMASTQMPTQTPTKIVRISAERFAFTPSEVTVERGTTVEFHVTSDDTDHGFHILDTAIDVEIPWIAVASAGMGMPGFTSV